MGRHGWDKYFIDIAKTIAGGSTCLRRKVGASIVKDRAIISIGCNGSPTHRSLSCSFEGCKREKLGIPSGESLHLCLATHAEVNAIAQAAKHGNSTDGATMYVTALPCSDCAKIIIGSGIKRVCYSEIYPNSESISMFITSGVDVVQLTEEG